MMNAGLIPRNGGQYNQGMLLRLVLLLRMQALLQLQPIRLLMLRELQLEREHPFDNFSLLLRP